MYIKEKLSEQYVATSENEVRSFTKWFSSVPQGKGLAGVLFEPLVHQDIMRGGAGSWSFYKLLGVECKSSEPFKFVYDVSAAETDSFLEIPQEQVKFHQRELPKQLINSQYYVPSESNFATGSAHLWVLQMTTSERHGGSDQGYVEI